MTNEEKLDYIKKITDEVYDAACNGDLEQKHYASLYFEIVSILEDNQ